MKYIKEEMKRSNMISITVIQDYPAAAFEFLCKDEVISIKVSFDFKLIIRLVAVWNSYFDRLHPKLQ